MELGLDLEQGLGLRWEREMKLGLDLERGLGLRWEREMGLQPYSGLYVRWLGQ